MNDISVLILAGGKSSRMGTDKALLKVQGQFLLSRIYKVAQTVSNQVFVVTSNPNKYQFILPRNTQFILETYPYQGPLMAFHYAMSFIQTKWVLLFACDLIYLGVEEVNLWLEQLSFVYDNQEQIVAFLPNNEKGWECLCGFYHCSCYLSLEESVKNGNRSFQNWLKYQKVKTLKVRNSQVLFNCNKPEDLPFDVFY